MKQAPAPTAPPAKHRGRSALLPILAAVAAFLLFVVDGVLFVGWFRMLRAHGALRQEQAQAEASNLIMADAHRVLANKKTQLCNRSSEDVTLDWISVAYEDAGGLKSFDSQRCADWTPVKVKAGSNRMLALSSAQEGCNWNGSVVFFAMHYTRGESQSFRDAGAWLGFDRDCYTIAQ
jgi:hypothetical protein